MRNSKVKFGDRIKEHRLQMKMTQADVSKKLFTTRQTISNWEKGKSYPDLNMLIKISDLYHVSIDSLLREDVKLKKSLERGKVASSYFGIWMLQYIIDFAFGFMVIIFLDYFSSHSSAGLNTSTLNFLSWVVVILCPVLVILNVRLFWYIGGIKLSKKFIKFFLFLLLLLMLVFLIIFLLVLLINNWRIDRVIAFGKRHFILLFMMGAGFLLLMAVSYYDNYRKGKLDE